MQPKTEYTGLNDKTGKPIHVGDLLELRLGLNMKHGGPSRVNVIRFGNNFHLVMEGEINTKYGGYKLTKAQADIAVVIDRAH